MPMNTTPAQNNVNNQAFNLTQQPQNNPQQQQNFGGFDFTNSSIPQNKERIDQQNRLNQLENALNNLNMNPQPQNPRMNMGMNMGLNMNNMMPNNMNFGGMNNMGMNNMNNMGMNNNNNNTVDPFADISLNTKGNQGNSGNNQPQMNSNNPFSFI